MESLREEPTGLLDKSTKFWLMQQIRAQLKELRHERDLTQAEVAEKLGKDQVYISNCESGRRRLDPIELLAFASIYDISLDEMFSNLDLKEAKERDYSL